MFIYIPTFIGLLNHNCVDRTKRLNQYLLTILEGLKFTIKPLNATGVISKPLWIHCQGSGYPPPRLFYFGVGKGGELNETFFKTLPNGTLYIPKLRAEDKGAYMCILKHDPGTPKTFKFYIRIKSK